MLACTYASTFIPGKHSLPQYSLHHIHALFIYTLGSDQMQFKWTAESVHTCIYLHNATNERSDWQCDPQFKSNFSLWMIKDCFKYIILGLIYKINKYVNLHHKNKLTSTEIEWCKDKKYLLWMVEVVDPGLEWLASWTHHTGRIEATVPCPNTYKNKCN